MALEGSLEDLSVVDLLQLIAAQKKAGVLSLSRGKETVQMTFIHGNIMNGFYGDEDEQLSNALIMAEKITIIQLRTALHAKPKGTPLAVTLIDLAYITREALQGWNQLLTQETIVSLLFWESGRYRFDDQEITENIAPYSPMSVDHLLREGIRQKEEWPILLSKIPSRDTVYSIVNQPAESTPSNTGNEVISTSLDELEEHLWLLEWIDGVRTVGSIVNHTGMGAFAVYKCLIELMAIGKIKEKQPEKKSSFLSQISLRQIALSPVVTNGLLVAALFVIVFIFIPSFFQEGELRSPRVESPFSVHPWIALNQKDRLTFALDLYHLRYGHYPLTLNRLIEERLINEEIPLNDFSYHSDGKTFDLALPEPSES